MPRQQHLVFTEGQIPALTFDAQKLETVSPFSHSEIFELLKIKPVSDWEKLFTILHKRHLVLLPRESDIPFLPDMDTDIGPTAQRIPRHIIDDEGNLETEFTAAVVPLPEDLAAHEQVVKKVAAKAQHIREREQREAKAKRALTRTQAHQKREDEQKAAAAKRKATRAAEHQKRLDAIAARKAASSTSVSDYRKLKTGADVVRHAEYLRETLSTRTLPAFGVSGAHALSLSTVPTKPLAVRLGHTRKARPQFKLEQCVDFTSERNRHEVLAELNRFVSQLSLLDRRLDEIFAEGKAKVPSKKQSYASVVNIGLPAASKVSKNKK